MSAPENWPAPKLAALLRHIQTIDEIDSMERAIAWTVAVQHVDDEPRVHLLYGAFTEPAAALAWAQEFENGLNEEGEEGFRCRVRPIMPAE